MVIEWFPQQFNDINAATCQCGTHRIGFVLSWSAISDVLRWSAQPVEYGIYALYIAVEKKWNRLGPIVGRHCECFFKWGQAVSCSQSCNGSVSHCLWNCSLMLMFSIIVVWFLRDWKMLQSMVFPMCWWKLFMSSENRDNGWKLAGLKSAWLKMQFIEDGNLQQSTWVDMFSDCTWDHKKYLPCPNLWEREKCQKTWKPWIPQKVLPFLTDENVMTDM